MPSVKSPRADAHASMPSSKPEERRRQRSDDAHTALSLQLAHVKDVASLDAVVLATAEGLVIAHAGDSELCAELAALAPLASTFGAIPANTNLGEGLMHVQTVPWEGAPLYLAGSSAALKADNAPKLAQWIGRAQAGVARILAA
jgi:hypothetical protein